jgi:RNA polymerase sigma factor (sigma-70 family)
MDDREAIAGIAAADPAGIAAAYDGYAAALYGYCRWMLRDPAEAAETLQDAFVIAAATIRDLPGVPKLRPWLYAVARKEGRRRLRSAPAAPGAEADPAADAGDVSAPTSLQAPVRSTLAGLKPAEREVVELTLRHGLYDDLATALGVSWHRAQARATRARRRLEKALAAPVAASTGREACAELDALLADRDGQLTRQKRDLVDRHIGRCETCASRLSGALRAAVVSGLSPLAELPAELREQTLIRCTSTAPDAVAYRRRAVRRAGSVWSARFWPTIRRLSWRTIGSTPRSATATIVLAVWVVAVWVVGMTLLMFTGPHSSRTGADRPSVRAPSSSAAAAAVATTAPTPAPTSPHARRSRTVRPSPAYVAPLYVPSASPTVRTESSPSPSKSPKPSKSASPSPSHSGSPSPSPSRTTSPSPSKTP